MKQICLVLLALVSMPALADDMVLADTMKALDTAVFDSFNHCQS
ncbi:DUF4440 domain-containing protein, partial [Shewanella sp. SG41-4]|nr:DUF4440 domain-containing protein [Shewanella sp. SG41-4]